jgi:putative transposase
VVKLSRRRAIVDHLQKAYDVSQGRALKATGFNRSSQRYLSRRDPQAELRMPLKELATGGALRLLPAPCAAAAGGMAAECEARLSFVSIVRRAARRSPGSTTSGPWILSRIHYSSRPFRILTVVDSQAARGACDCRENELPSLKGGQELDRMIRPRGKPKSIRCDNGPEFSGRMLGKLGAPWAKNRGKTRIPI